MPSRLASMTAQKLPRWVTCSPLGSWKATIVATPAGWPTAASATRSPDPAGIAAPQKLRCVLLDFQTSNKSSLVSTASDLSPEKPG
uniref:Uncharacterized protein n=1 Tax=Hippocampus comes TaxID=109280 RepID=A0A3Q2XSQ9_HIPCM